MNATPPKIRIQRILTGISQTELAQRIGRSQGWISTLERGKPGAAVSERDVKRIGEALGVPPEKLFTQVGE